MRASSDDTLIMTDDGSYGRQGLVTQGIEEVIRREKVDKCFAIGPAVMMKFCCLTTKKYGIPTEVSLNTIMVDGTGMCGACRINVGGVTKFVCVDGPEFDGHAVDFDEMLKRMGAFKQEEIEALHPHEAQTSATEMPQSNTPGEPQHVLTATEADLHSTDRNAAWRKALRSAVPPRERMAQPRVEMPALDGRERAHLLRSEVNRGLTAQMAQQEARRCLDCANPGCRQGCPVGIDIPRFVKHIEAGHFLEAAATLRETSSLPAVCGRVCPQEKQCESRCIHLKTHKPAVAIGHLERFAADYALAQAAEHPATPTTPTQVSPTHRRKVAVVGSGPAGLSFAGEMVKEGFAVTVFEALHEVGGVLKYGIPEFRLPNRIVEAEIKTLEAQGVEFVTDCVVGKTLSVDDLKAEGALRLGAATATIVYRRSEEEMPARLEEVHHAKEEGVTFLTLHNPLEYIADETGAVKQVVLQKMELGEPDASGRRSPVPILGATETLDCDLVVVSIGVSPNPIVPRSIAGLELGRKNTIAVDEDMRSNLPTIFAGGDIVRGGATVILAMGDGRRAAQSMARQLRASS